MHNNYSDNQRQSGVGLTMGKKRVLVVDDEAMMRSNIVDLLSPRDCELIEAADGEEAVTRFAQQAFDLVLLDINLPKKDGLSALTEMKVIAPDTPIVIFTAYGTGERAIRAMKKGAFDYLEKPFELDEFLLVVERALEFSDLINEIRELRGESNRDAGLEKLEIVGRSPRMREIFKLIGRVATSDETVLIQGQSGTGKELIADAIQRHSRRKDQPYVKVNCGAFSEGVLESEIFGHEKGSFTGAIARKQGRFELADHGTIMLDEVNNMPASLQVRLLRVLENKTFYRVGGEESVKVDVRVIAASNRDLEQEVKNGQFRRDLFYRLNVVKIDIPSLAQRTEDIPVLADYFLKKHCPDRDLIIPDSEMRRLQTYSWPGNVRELENTVRSAIVMSRGDVVNIGDLPMSGSTTDDSRLFKEQLKKGDTLKEIVSDVEKRLIIYALRQTGWNRTEAASLLGIHRRLLYSKIKEYDIAE